MQDLIKTIKKLSQEDYELLHSELLSASSSGKPLQFIEAARTMQIKDAELMGHLEMSASAYYTLKSRLNSRISSLIARKVDNPTKELMDEVAAVPAMVYSNNPQATIRVLKDLEKQLIQYDLSNELIVIYQALSTLHLHDEEHDYYSQLYNKHVAFSLAVAKAESLYFTFMKLAGEYKLSGQHDLYIRLQDIVAELHNIFELYDSHRLFVFLHICRLYNILLSGKDFQFLKNLESDFMVSCERLADIIERHPRDTMYTNLRFLPESLAFQFSLKTKNYLQAAKHFEAVNSSMLEVAQQPIHSYHVIEFLAAKLRFITLTGDSNYISDNWQGMENYFDPTQSNIYPYAEFQMLLATIKFYQGNYDEACRILNTMRNNVAMRNLPQADRASKGMLLLMYAIQEEYDLTIQYCNSLARTMRAEKEDERYDGIRLLLKIVKVMQKDMPSDKRYSKIQELWSQFVHLNSVASFPLFPYLQLTDRVVRTMAKLSHRYMAA